MSNRVFISIKDNDNDNNEREKKYETEKKKKTENAKFQMKFDMKKVIISRKKDKEITLLRQAPRSQGRKML